MTNTCKSTHSAIIPNLYRHEYLRLSCGTRVGHCPISNSQMHIFRHKELYNIKDAPVCRLPPKNSHEEMQLQKDRRSSRELTPAPRGRIVASCPHALPTNLDPLRIHISEVDTLLEAVQRGAVVAAAVPASEALETPPIFSGPSFCACHALEDKSAMNIFCFSCVEYVETYTNGPGTRFVLSRLPAAVPSSSGFLNANPNPNASLFHNFGDDKVSKRPYIRGKARVTRFVWRSKRARRF